MHNNTLDIFNELTKKWFIKALGEPTQVQREAWPAIAGGSHTLVSAPTGTGKTLSAFLVFIDRLKAQAREGTLRKELQLIYISPLKALAGDIRENLHRPLYGILDEEITAGVRTKDALFDINVAIRTGDTTQEERRKMIKSPPHILITTPESLYLLLTSISGQSILKTAQAIIIDELHAMIDTKRGAHLTLSLARLDRLCQRPLQRIGLSATIDPLAKAAEYLAGSESQNVKIAAPVMQKDVDIIVASPSDNMYGLPNGTIWPEIARSVYDLCDGTRSVIAFVDGRRYAEKLAYQVNVHAGTDFARTHHGCVSKEQRLQAETDLRSGKLRLLCATSSMELGIDVGDIDRVIQIGCPSSVSSVLQRLGRAGHNPGRVSVMYMFPRTAAEGLYCGLTAKAASDRRVERMSPPRLCLDVLAQHLVSMATGDGYTIDEVMEILPHAYPFKDVTRDDVKSVLGMLAGDYEHKRDIPVRPRVLYDRINERVNGDAYSRMLAVSTGGTIPDTGMFAVKTESGVKLGELDEEFVFEQRVGAKFLLGSFAWKIARIDKDTVTVASSSTAGAMPPFWKNGLLSRKLQTGIEFGKLMRKLTEAGDADSIIAVLKGFGLDEPAAQNAVGFLRRQVEATGVFPDDRTLIVEHFSDEAGDNQMMIHSIFGRQVNAPLALLLQETVKRIIGCDILSYEDDDGILLLVQGKRELPEGLLKTVKPNSARPILTALLPKTPLFNILFRHNAARSLMMGVRRGKRQPLWVQRLRGAEMLDSIISFDDHPIIRETKRECLEDYWDLPGLENLLNSIHSGAVQVREITTANPSPMSLTLRRAAEADQIYNYVPTTSGIAAAGNKALEETLRQMQAIKPAAEQLAKLSERRKLPEDEKQLHSMLMIEGDLIAGELDIPHKWFGLLASDGRALYVEPGLWIAAEQADEYASALERSDLESRLNIVRRFLRYRGAQYPEQIAERYFWSDSEALTVLTRLCESNNAIESDGLYYHADLYERARHQTISARRKQIQTMPPERYAAILTERVKISAPPSEQLQKTLQSLSNQPFPLSAWENSLLPIRVNAYRPALLDSLLASGEMFWSVSHTDGNTGLSLSFHMYEDIDWDSDMTDVLENLDGDEHIIYNALLKRGATFTNALSSLLDSKSAYDVLICMSEKGLIRADSFIPIRQILEKDRLQKTTAKQRVNAKMMLSSAGRWDVLRPLKQLTIKQQLEQAFDKSVILCRETVSGLDISWSSALETLRVWEYTGQVRRGYFVEGLSGAQFIREKDFTGVILSLENPSEDIIWLPAADPCQPWGKSLRHLVDKNFINASGTVVAFQAGVPLALFERQGHTLRVFCGESEETALTDALRLFVKHYSERKIFPSLKRLTVKQYPAEAAKLLTAAGFIPIVMDFALHQGLG